jgi:hypothetical protein
MKYPRACPYCDILNPPEGNPLRSHGLACREHVFTALQQMWGMTPEAAKSYIEMMEKKDPDAFPPNTSGAKESDPLPKRS